MPAFVNVFAKLACPFTSGTVARIEAPCLKVNGPVGTIPFIPVTVAVSVTAWPTVDGSDLILPRRSAWLASPSESRRAKRSPGKPRLRCRRQSTNANLRSESAVSIAPCQG